MSNNNRSFSEMLVREAEVAVGSSDFATVYRITKEFAGGRNPLVIPVSDVTGRLLLQ